MRVWKTKRFCIKSMIIDPARPTSFALAPSAPSNRLADRSKPKKASKQANKQRNKNGKRGKFALHDVAFVVYST